jgi:hypothetical protein
MITITRKVTRTDIDGVLALIGLLSDAKGCASRLSDLTAAAEQATVAEQTALAAQKEVFAATQTAQERAAADLARDAERGNKLSAWEKDVSEKAAAVEQKAAELAARGNHLAAWANDLESKDAAALLRDSALTERESKLIRAEDAVAKLRAAYEEKIERLRSLAGE